VRAPASIVAGGLVAGVGIVLLDHGEAFGVDGQGVVDNGSYGFFRRLIGGGFDRFRFGRLFDVLRNGLGRGRGLRRRFDPMRLDGERQAGRGAGAERLRRAAFGNLDLPGNGFVGEIGALAGAAITVAATVAARAALAALLVLFLGMGAAFFLEQRQPVRDRDLVVIRMDFGEGEEPVPVAAVIDESRLERGLHARHFRQIDVAAKLFLGGGFEIEFLDAITAQHHHPGLFRVGCVDEHFVGHEILLRAWARAFAAPAVKSRGLHERARSRCSGASCACLEKGEG
jgi:hypothetical protein